MTKSVRTLVCLLFLSLAAVSNIASAANYTLWINGRGGGGTLGDYTSFTYWGPASTDAGINKKAVNWDGYNSIASQNYRIRDALDCFCTGSNWCYIATHSAGDLMLGYTLANYGSSTRKKKNTVPNSAGQCGDTDGSTQVGWNIKWVRVASGAGGGSELSDLGYWATRVQQGSGTGEKGAGGIRAGAGKTAISAERMFDESGVGRQAALRNRLPIACIRYSRGRLRV